MTAMTVTTTPQLIPDPWSDLQNLGSGDCWLGRTNSVSASTGLKLAAGQTYSRPTGGFDACGPPVWIVATADTQNVRLL